MLKRVLLTGTLMAIGAVCSAQSPGFSKNEVQVQADDFEYSQILFYNYTTGEADFEEPENGDNTLERPIQRFGWVSYWLYDYDAARYTESVLVGHRVY